MEIKTANEMAMLVSKLLDDNYTETELDYTDNITVNRPIVNTFVIHDNNTDKKYLINVKEAK